MFLSEINNEVIHHSFRLFVAKMKIKNLFSLFHLIKKKNNFKVSFILSMGHSGATIDKLVHDKIEEIDQLHQQYFFNITILLM